MKKNILRRSRLFVLILGVLLMAGVTLEAGLSGSVSAAPITARSLTLEAGTVPGSAPGDGNSGHTVKHLFTFTIGSTSTLGSIKFQYCTNPDPAITCTLPNGLVTTAATLTSQSGANTGFTLVNTTNGAPYLTRTAAGGVMSSSSSYELSGIQNPDNTNCFSGTTPESNNCTFYVRISTYASTDTTGSSTDTGSVAASTATPIVLTGYMPESLVFCTGGTVSTTSGVPDCSTATSGDIAFNQDFSPTDTATATSQMAASTNAGTGYQITVNGNTLTSGLNSITSIGTPGGGSIKGIGQFGLNLKLNTAASAPSFPGNSAEVAPTPDGVDLKGQAVSPYNTADSFAFNSSDSVADSGNGGLGGSDAQIFTVSYIVNVPGHQPAGSYTTTLTYICTPTF